MDAKLFRIVICLAALLPAAPAFGQSYDSAALRMFRELRAKPNPLDRYLFLEKITPSLPKADEVLAEQMSAFALSELGLYTQAVLAFPLKMNPVAGLDLPEVSEWKSVDAVDAISRAAASRKVVMINEVHHDAQTRAIMLNLLPRLRALGFNYLALEALKNDPGLAKRGYPVRSSGTEYLQEPIYGEIVREAVRLGFVLVPYDYDTAGSGEQARERGQASNIYDRVFARDPNARLVVFAGYAHVDKATGRLGYVRPMAMELAKMVGSEPLSIDQTQFLDVDWSDDDHYKLEKRFPAKEPEVLVNRSTGRIWSADPQLYDISVISPPALNLEAFGKVSRMKAPPTWQEGGIRHVNPGTSDSMIRPSWVELGGLRHAYPINAGLCRDQIPCAVDAHYVNEPDDATPADIYAFFSGDANTKLYLRPGRYRLRAWNSEGKTLSQSNIDVH